MTGRLTGKRAFLTAAGAGIGHATALAFAAEGAYVIATDLKPELMANLKAGGVAETHALDVRSTAAVDALASQVGPVDILFNCAGFVHHGTVGTTSDEDWDLSFDINAKAMHRTIRAFLPGMLAKSDGSIINISSGASSVRGIPNRYAYGASKAAVVGLTKAVAADYIRQGIRANSIAPGTIQSPSLDGRIEEQAEKQGKTVEEIRQQFIDRQPMGRLGTAEEIASLAIYLASDESRYTTGQVYLSDGGFSL
ncbi:SDR family oxidoreductase [Kaistia terrae]|jgi:2-keto-3-deoxy-L-fuconate dehydrogenase|uniref:SDR family oxidoreductase n=1 Tax=Kaistia terrae TaxID=537017 RepID=A0ABW0PNW4_9HYPH|nr:SDR family oxidoreductase [Kaistia terrae]MCX5579994.1 SDR family oxidoreductase [Kaistia terrae]